MQQGDVKLFNESDGGNIQVTDGIVTMSGGLDTAAYLSLFGGNENDAGGSDKRLQWWGNVSEVEQAKTYRSETQYILKSLPATSGNLLLLREAAKRDLQWFIDSGIASTVEVTATIPALNRVDIFGSITADGNKKDFRFSENWRAQL